MAKLCNTREAAELLGVSTSYLNKLRCAGHGPKFIKMGRRVLYDLRDLDAFVNTRKYLHTSECSSSPGGAA